MTARGELYVDEECRDFFEKELDEWFGKGKWYLRGSPFGNYWDICDFPKVIQVEVIDDEYNIIGKVEIESDFYIEEQSFGREIEIKPKSIKKIK